MTKKEAIESFKKMFDEAVTVYTNEPIKTSYTKENMEQIIEGFIREASLEVKVTRINNKEVYYETEYCKVKDRFAIEGEKIIIYREISIAKPLKWIDINLEISSEGVKVNE